MTKHKQKHGVCVYIHVHTYVVCLCVSIYRELIDLFDTSI